jgi:hypothetical protein
MFDQTMDQQDARSAHRLNSKIDASTFAVRRLSHSYRDPTVVSRVITCNYLELSRTIMIHAILNYCYWHDLLSVEVIWSEEVGSNVNYNHEAKWEALYLMICVISQQNPERISARNRVKDSSDIRIGRPETCSLCERYSIQDN